MEITFNHGQLDSSHCTEVNLSKKQNKISKLTRI